MIAFFTGHWEILIVLVVALLLFGHRIPGLARSLGSGIVEFKKGLKGESDKKNESADQAQLPPPSPSASAKLSEGEAAERRGSSSATSGPSS